MRKINVSPIEFSTVMLAIVLLFSAIVMLQDSAFGGELDKEMNAFVENVQVKNNPSIIVKDIYDISTGRKWKLSEKIRGSLVKALKKKFAVIDRAEQAALDKEKEASISGYSVSTSGYFLDGKYEVKEDIVRILINILSVNNSEIIVSEEIIISRKPIEPYLKDYSENELDRIIGAQGNEIKALLKQKKDAVERSLKFQRIKHQRESIARIKTGEVRPFNSRLSQKKLWIGIALAWYGSVSFSAADLIEKDGKSSTFPRLIGVASLVGSGWCFYSHYQDNGFASIRFNSSRNKVSFQIAKKF